MEETAPPPPNNLIDLLDRLVLPGEPPPVSMMPQTWGWVALGLILLALSGYGLWRYLRHRRANAYRRAALHLLAECHDDPARIAEILRRTALAAFPRADVASLTGDGWLRFLDQHAKGASFASKGQAIAIAPYRPMPADPALTRAAEAWIRQHRAQVAL
jgi:uncharacterized iron-regulated membrane protein